MEILFCTNSYVVSLPLTIWLRKLASPSVVIPQPVAVKPEPVAPQLLISPPKNAVLSCLNRIAELVVSYPILRKLPSSLSSTPKYQASLPVCLAVPNLRRVAYLLVAIPVVLPMNKEESNPVKSTFPPAVIFLATKSVSLRLMLPLWYSVFQLFQLPA